MSGAPDPPGGTPAPAPELFALMRCAPTTRRFGPEAVPLEAIHQALEHARFAPSGGNRQGWRVVVVDDPALRRTLRDLYLPHWRAYLESLGVAAALREARSAAPEGPGSSRLRMLQAADDFAARLDEVPVHLVVGVELEALAIVDAQLPRPSIVAGASIYPFVQNVLLGLRAQGLGAAFTTLITPAEPEVKRLLAMPEGIALAGHIAVGYRAEKWPSRLRRRPVEEFAFANRYGEPLPVGG